MLKKGTLVLCNVVNARVPYGYPGRVLYVDNNCEEYEQGGVYVAFEGAGVQRFHTSKVVRPIFAYPELRLAYEKLKRNNFELPPFHRRLNVALRALQYSPSDLLFAYDPQYRQFRHYDKLGIICFTYHFSCHNDKGYVVSQDGFGNFMAYDMSDKDEALASNKDYYLRLDVYNKKYHPDYWSSYHKE